jgi:hypothetical protein
MHLVVFDIDGTLTDGNLAGQDISKGQANRKMMHRSKSETGPDRVVFRNLLVFLFMVLVPSSAYAAGGGSTPVKETEVTVFQPAVPGGSSRSGECWTDSIAVSRSGAWRCMVGNEIYDPCFSNAGLTGAVICDANPARGSAGFILKLTKALPEPSSKGPAYPRPWLVKLADGATCEIETGTIALVAGLEVPYGCSDSQECGEKGCPYMTGLTDKFNRSKVWMADKVAFKSSNTGLELISRTSVAVTAVWK